MGPVGVVNTHSVARKVLFLCCSGGFHAALLVTRPLIASVHLGWVAEAQLFGLIHPRLPTWESDERMSSRIEPEQHRQCFVWWCYRM